MNFSENDFSEICISSFGPLDLNPSSENYGKLLSVPSKKKEGWKNQSIVQMLQSKFKTKPISIQTDVNASAYCEFIERRNQVKNSIAYITVGTGIGVGLIINNHPVNGLMHPEGGHIPLSINYNKEIKANNACNYHQNCVEGYSTNVYASKHLNVDLNNLKEYASDPVFEDIAKNIGQLCASVCLITSVEKIVIGGGLSQSNNFLPNVKKSFKDVINGYIPLEHKFEDYIVLCEDYNMVGMKGAAYLSLIN